MDIQLFDGQIQFRLQGPGCFRFASGRARSDNYLGYPGLVLSTNTMEQEIPSPALTADEARQCAQRIAQGEHEPVLSVGTSKVPCTLRRPAEMARLQFTFEFFEKAYPAGLNNTVVFLASCRSGLNHYLRDQLTGRPPRPGASAAGVNRNEAAFGFDMAVDAGDAWATVREFIRLDKLGFHSAEKVERLKEMDRIAHLVGRALAPEDEPPSVTPPEIVEREQGKTHSRDIVLLVDPATGEELLDGATVQVVRAAGADADRLAIHPQLLGVAEEEAPPTLGLQVRVMGEPVPRETYLPDRQVEEGAYRYANTVTLGRTHRVGEVVDLEARADLPGGGESRWIYRNVRLNSCHWETELTGHVNRRVRGSRITVSPALLGRTERDGILGISLGHAPGPEGSHALTFNFPGQAQVLETTIRVASLWQRPITFPISSSDKGTVRLALVKPGERIVGEFDVEFDFVLKFPGVGRAAPIEQIDSPVRVRGEFTWTPPCQPMSLKEKGEDLLLRRRLDPEWRHRLEEGRRE